MQCISHPTRSAIDTCNQCGNWICDDCTVEIQGRLFCRPCLAVLAAGPMPQEPHGAPARPGVPRKRVSFGLLFLFSCFFPPGANYMFMGLIQRGLAAMCGFFLLIFLIAASPMPLTLILALSLPVYILTCIFDGFHIRRRINAGETVNDGISDILNTVLSNRKLTFAILAVVGISLAGTILGFAVRLIGGAIPIILICLLLYAILKRRKPKA